MTEQEFMDEVAVISSRHAVFKTEDNRRFFLEKITDLSRKYKGGVLLDDAGSISVESLGDIDPEALDAADMTEDQQVAALLEDAEESEEEESEEEESEEEESEEEESEEEESEEEESVVEKPKRKRRTKAEIAADKAAEEESKAKSA